MKALVILLVLALGIGPALAGGDSGYRPEYFGNGQNISGNCGQLVAEAERGLSRTHAANMPTVEKYLNEARAAKSAGNNRICVARAQQAVHWEY